MSAKSKFRRLQDLFETGQIIVVEQGGETITLWAAKPNPFERDEAAKDARAHRARAMLTFDRDEDQKAVQQNLLLESSDDELVRTLTLEKDLEHTRLARNEVRADPEWAERLEALDRADLDGATDEQRQMLEDLNLEFASEVLKRKAVHDREARADLMALGREELEKRFVAGFRAMVGSQAFSEAMRQTEIYYALRDCQATRVEDGWDHARCDHRARLLDRREDVFSLPEPVLEQAVDVLNALMSEEEAGNSAAPSASSGPSEQPAAQGDSTPSTPTATSRRRATTSS